MDDIFVFLFSFSTLIKNKVVLFCYLGVVKVADLPLIIARGYSNSILFWLFAMGSGLFVQRRESSFCSFVNTNAV